MTDTRPVIIGLTGSVAMGKSETARMFEALGCAVFDADACVHELYSADGAGTAVVAELFPEAVGADGVDRKALAAAVLRDRKRLEALESAVHPLVAAQRRIFLENAAAAGHAIVVFDIPLLFETDSCHEVDVVVVVSAPLGVQRARALERQDMTLEKFQNILARQMPDHEKRARADFIVETGHGRVPAFRQVEQIVRTLKAGRLPV